MYRVTAYFIDLQDGEHPYNVGDAFPREGHTVSEDRIKELASSNNKRKMPLIEIIPDPEPEKKVRKAAPAAKEAKSDRSGSSGSAKSKPRKTK